MNAKTKQVNNVPQKSVGSYSRGRALRLRRGAYRCDPYLGIYHYECVVQARIRAVCFVAIVE